MPIRNLNVSPLGDFLSISGNGILSVWTRDGDHAHSYSNFIYYSKEENKNIMAAIIKQQPIGNIV